MVFKFLKRILQPRHIPDKDRRVYLTEQDFAKLSKALRNGDCYLPYHLMDFGTNFESYLGQIKFPQEKLTLVKANCAKYLSVLCQELVDLLPHTAQLYEALQFFSPAEATRVDDQRAKFMQLPFGLLRK